MKFRIDLHIHTKHSGDSTSEPEDVVLHAIDANLNGIAFTEHYSYEASEFADELRDALCRAGAIENRVFGHTTAGHTTNNPHARFFDGSNMAEGGTGGYWIARPGGPLWRKWAKYLREGAWMHVPYQDLAEIRSELDAM